MYSPRFTTFNNLTAHLAVIVTIGQFIAPALGLDANPLFWPAWAFGYISLGLFALVIDQQREIRRLASERRQAVLP